MDSFNLIHLDVLPRIKTCAILLFFMLVLDWVPFLGTSNAFSKEKVGHSEKELRTIETLRTQVEHLSEKSQRLRSEIAELNHKVKRLAQEIDQLKKQRQSNTENNLLIDYRLENHLKDSNEISQKLTPLNEDLEQNEQKLRNQIEKLLPLYDRLIQNLTNEFAETKNVKKQEKLLTSIHQYRQERESYAQKIQNVDSLKVFDITMDPLDGPEELREKADILTDSAEKISRTIKLIDQRIDELKETSYLLQETLSFTSDSDFFGETVFRTARNLTIPSKEKTANEDKDSGNTDTDTTVDSQPEEGAPVDPASGGSDPTTPEQPNSPTSGVGDSQVINVANNDLLQTLDLSVEILLKGSQGLGHPEEIKKAIQKLKNHRSLLVNQAQSFQEESQTLQKRAKELMEKERKELSN